MQIYNLMLEFYKYTFCENIKKKLIEISINWALLHYSLISEGMCSCHIEHLKKTQTVDVKDSPNILELART